MPASGEHQQPDGGNRRRENRKINPPIRVAGQVSCRQIGARGPSVRVRGSGFRCPHGAGWRQPSEVSIDIVLGALPLEDEIVRGARNVEITGVRLPLAAPESIVVMKTLARRARDIADIEGILEVHDELDLDWIRIRLTEFDQALGETELLDEFSRILACTRRTTASDDSAG